MASGTQRGTQGVDPLCLPVGTRVGPWRVESWRDRGTYGTLYRVVHEGRERAGPFALKLAIYPGDERFEREAWLLARVHSRYVPGLEAQGVWAHPRGAFPYLVMQWIEGESLYEWAARRNPSSRQGLGLLAQVARALEATHAVGGVHRDVKGANVLVRTVDGQAFLTDFGAGHYRGAATLTTRLLPPGTPGYRSPETWGFVRVFERHPTAHYAASACDDLFSLGVTAWRLVADEYPPPTMPGEPGSELWREGGVGPGSLRALNPRVSAGLEAHILRLLAVPPVERFEGRAKEAAEALEQEAERPEPELDTPLFAWGSEPAVRWRARGEVHEAETQDAAERAQEPLTEVREQARPGAGVRVWGGEGLVAVLGLVLATLLIAGAHRGQKAAQQASGISACKIGKVAVADSVTPVAPMVTGGGRSAIGLPMPETPFPGQRTPPCTRNGEVEVRGGCWYRLGDATLPCKDDAYEWKQRCYLPSEPRQRGSTSHPP